MLQIKKRNGELVSFAPTKILNRIKRAAKGLKTVNSDEIFIKVITSMPTEGVINTFELDTLIAETAESYITSHYEYSKLASAIAISSFHKSTSDNFYETMLILNKKDEFGKSVVHDELIEKIEKYGADKVNAILNYENDYNFDFFAFRTLQKMYLLKNSKGVILERPQHMYMRIALWVTDSFEDAVDYYNELTNQLISKASPIMINSGTLNAQLASCVLHYNNEDSKEGLLGTFSDIATYSSNAAGIGLCMSNQRSKESFISTSGGKAGGLLKYLKIVNEGLRFFDQNGKRPGSAAIYLEPWHKDIFDLLDIKKNTGQEELRARDIFTALWVPDNFMRAVRNDSDYYLFCPNEIKKAGLKPLQEIYGEEFEAEYNKAIELGLGKKVKAKDIWVKVYESQIETGVPYIGFKDNVNKKSNHKNIGTVKQSNLCIEIVQYTDEVTTAICTLSSIVLKNFVKGKEFDFNKLFNSVRKATKALNKVIDINHYSTEKGKKGGLEQRAIAIGVQGLADTFYLLDLDFISEEAKLLNKQIFETIYYAALKESCELVKEGKYKPYSYFEGSPISQGIFQFDMWGIDASQLSGLWDWESLRNDIVKYGVANSLVTAAMPTASSAKITGSYEMFEPMHSNLFNRRVIGGEYTIVNKYLIDDLEKLGLWCDKLKNEIILNEGSIQNINFLKYFSSDEKNYEKKVARINKLIKKYRTIWEFSQKDLMNMAIDRAAFIDQTQSMNVYFSNPTLGKLTSSHFYAWENGLKTGCYYVRTKAISTGAKHLAVDVSKNDLSDEEKEMLELNRRIQEEKNKNNLKPTDSNFECLGCSS